MGTYWLGTARGLSLPAVLLLLAACGGGGGGDGSSAGVVYAGNTNPATVTTANASKLTANVVGGNDIGAIIPGVSIEGGGAAQNRGSGATDLALRLNRSFRDILVRAQRSSAAQQAARAVMPIDETVLCDGGNGSVRTSGTLNDNNTGTLTVTFNNCLIDGVTFNGPTTLRVDAFDLDFFVPTDFTISFSRLTLRGTGLSVDAGGSLRTQSVIGTNTETFTENLVTLDNNTSLMTKIEDFRVVNVYDDIFLPTFFTANISGRVFDQADGYVDVATIAPLFFGTLNQLFPDSGQMLLTGAPAGAGNRSIRATALLAPPAALPATLASLELDLDGNSTYEINARLKWTDLSGPVGSDLADNEGDVMHNSWETVNGLDPDVNDAADDKDSDGAGNLIEYQAGTDPSDASSHP